VAEKKKGRRISLDSLAEIVEQECRRPISEKGLGEVFAGCLIKAFFNFVDQWDMPNQVQVANEEQEFNADMQKGWKAAIYAFNDLVKIWIDTDIQEVGFPLDRFASSVGEVMSTLRDGKHLSSYEQKEQGDMLRDALRDFIEDMGRMLNVDITAEESSENE
jgi:hypothetical protein